MGQQSNRTLYLLLKEMQRLNRAQLSRLVRQSYIKVFFFPISKDTGKEVDINGKTPFGDISSFGEAQQTLKAYYKSDLSVWSLMNAECVPSETDSQAFYCTFCDQFGNEQKIRVRFWRY